MSDAAFTFQCFASAGAARAGVFMTPHGAVETPAFMAVGTLATVKALDQYLSVQCPDRIAAKKSESGEMHFTILTDTSGSVTRAELVQGSGDELLDGLFGTVAAQLKVDSLRATTTPTATRKLQMGFSCSSTAAVATLQVLPR